MTAERTEAPFDFDAYQESVEYQRLCVLCPSVLNGGIFYGDGRIRFNGMTRPPTPEHPCGLYWWKGHWRSMRRILSGGLRLMRGSCRVCHRDIEDRFVRDKEGLMCPECYEAKRREHHGTFADIPPAPRKKPTPLRMSRGPFPINVPEDLRERIRAAKREIDGAMSRAICHEVGKALQKPLHEMLAGIDFAKGGITDRIRVEGNGRSVEVDTAKGDTVKDALDKLEAEEADEIEGNGSLRVVYDPGPAPIVGAHESGFPVLDHEAAPDLTGGFKSFAEYLQAVRRAEDGDVDPRLENLRTGCVGTISVRAGEVYRLQKSEWCEAIPRHGVIRFDDSGQVRLNADDGTTWMLVDNDWHQSMPCLQGDRAVKDGTVEPYPRSGDVVLFDREAVLYAGDGTTWKCSEYNGPWLRVHDHGTMRERVERPAKFGQISLHQHFDSGCCTVRLPPVPVNGHVTNEQGLFRLKCDDGSRWKLSEDMQSWERVSEGATSLGILPADERPEVPSCNVGGTLTAEALAKVGRRKTQEALDKAYRLIEGRPDAIALPCDESGRHYIPGCGGKRHFVKQDPNTGLWEYV